MNTWNSGGAAFWRTWQSAYSLTHRGGPGIEERVGFTSIPGGQSERVGTLGGMLGGFPIIDSSPRVDESHLLPRSKGTPVKEGQCKCQTARSTRILRAAFDAGSVCSFGHNKSTEGRRNCSAVDHRRREI
jgi:hypothetical protein